MARAVDAPDATRALSLGWPERRGALGLTRRLELLSGIRPLRGRRVLDVGCGDGGYTERLLATFDEVVGVEVEPVRLQAFRDRVPEIEGGERLELRLQSGEELADPDGCYDAVISIETLEHVLDDARVVSEVYRVLEPGGAFFVTVPNRGFPFETHSFRIRGREIRSKWYPFVPWIRPLHRRISTARSYRPRDLRALFGAVGFEEIGTTFLMPPLERWGPGRHLRPLVHALERTPLRHLGVSVVTVFAKPGRDPGAAPVDEAAADVTGDVVIDLTDGADRRAAAQTGTGSRRPVRTS